MKMTLKALSPVHIWSGSSMSPYTDFIADNDKVYYIDREKLDSIICSNEHLIDEYCTIIKSKKSHIQDKNTLKDFFSFHKINPLLCSFLCLNAIGDVKSCEIVEIVKTSGRPYIPGSSIKGAIRTALIFDAVRARGYDMKKLKAMSRLGGKDYYVGQDVLRENPAGVQSDVLKHLHVSDTCVIDSANIVIYKEVLVDLTETRQKGELIQKSPVVSEALRTGTEVTFEIKCKGEEFDGISDRFSFLAKGREKELFAKINLFYKNNIERYISNMKKAGKDIFSKVISAYTEYLDMIDEMLHNNDGFILRVGSHKNFYDNTISAVLSKDDMDRIRKAISGRGSRTPLYQPFPKTDWYIIENGLAKEAPGWMIAKLC